MDIELLGGALDGQEMEIKNEKEIPKIIFFSNDDSAYQKLLYERMYYSQDKVYYSFLGYVK